MDIPSRDNPIKAEPMPIRISASSRSTFALGLLAVALIFIVIGATVEHLVDRVPAANGEGSATEVLAPAPVEPPVTHVPPSPPLDPARGLYVDRFHGFALNPPPGWVEYYDRLYSVAPAEAAMLAPDHDRTSDPRAHFTVWVSTSRQTARNILRRERRIARRGDTDVEFQTIRLAGRTATVTTVRGDACTPCVSESVLLQWDAGTSVSIKLTAGSDETYGRNHAAMWRMIRSLRPARRDPFADDIQAFLAARTQGHGARVYLTRGALEQLRTWGLYKGDGDEPAEFGDYEVLTLTRRRDRVIVKVRGAGFEELVFAAGRNLDGELRPVVLHGAQLIQAPGTS